MSGRHFLSCLCVTALTGVVGACSFGDPADEDVGQTAPVTIEPFPPEVGVKPLDHQAEPLPADPPIRFKKLFALGRGWQRGAAFSFVAFSPNGRILAASRAEGRQPNEVALWDLQSRKLLHRLAHTNDPDERVGAIAFLSGGDRVVTACWKRNKVFLWDVQTGNLLETLDAGGKANKSVTGLAAFPDGKRVICCAGSGLIVWDTDRKTQETLSLKEHVPVGRFRTPTYPGYCSSAAFTADGSHFAGNVNDVLYAPTLLVFDGKTCRVTGVSPIRPGNYFLAYAPDGSSFAADYYDPDLPHSFDPTVGKTVVGIWDVRSGKKILAGRLFNWGTCDLTYTRDGKYLVAAGVHRDRLEGGGTPVIGVWDLSTGKVVNEIRAASSPFGLLPASLAISPDNKLLAVPGPEIEIYAIEYAQQPKRR